MNESPIENYFRASGQKTAGRISLTRSLPRIVTTLSARNVVYIVCRIRSEYKCNNEKSSQIFMKCDIPYITTGKRLLSITLVQ